MNQSPLGSVGGAGAPFRAAVARTLVNLARSDVGLLPTAHGLISAQTLCQTTACVQRRPRCRCLAVFGAGLGAADRTFREK